MSRAQACRKAIVVSIGDTCRTVPQMASRDDVTGGASTVISGKLSRSGAVAKKWLTSSVTCLEQIGTSGLGSTARLSMKMEQQHL
eukprot:4441213-Lingulodinium_polyedra.AAC.1